MYLKINTSINYMFNGDKFTIFFQNENLSIKNPIFGKTLSKFFTIFLKKSFIKKDFNSFFVDDNIVDLDGINSIYNLFIKNDVFIKISEGYKELFYISKKWYNPYNITYKLDYKYSDIPYYYNNGVFSKNIVDINSIDDKYIKKVKSRKSYRTEYIKTNKNIFKDLDNLLKISYGNIDFRKHTHVCSGDDISTIHKTVPSAGGFYNIILFTLLSDGTITYFNGERNIVIADNLNYFDLLEKLLTKSAIWANNSEKEGAIQFLNVNNTKGITFAFGIVDKMFKKYYHKTLPFLLLEAGHIFQNLSLFSSELRIGTLEVGSVLEENILFIIENNIKDNNIKDLFREKKLLYLNTMLLGYIKE